MGYVDLLAPRALRTVAGIELRVRSHLGRSVPLAVVSVEVAIDGVDVDPSRIRFCVNDCDFALSELPELHDEWWFVLDPARIRVVLDDAGEEHDVEVLLSIRPPFIPFAVAVPARVSERRRVKVGSEEAVR